MLAGDVQTPEAPRLAGHGQFSPGTHRKVNAACDWAAAAGREASELLLRSQLCSDIASCVCPVPTTATLASHGPQASAEPT